MPRLFQCLIASLVLAVPALAQWPDAGYGNGTLPAGPGMVGALHRNAAGQLVPFQSAPPAVTEPGDVQPPSEVRRTDAAMGGGGSPRARKVPSAQERKVAVLPVNPLVPRREPMRCAVGALACVEVVSVGDSQQANIPVTFGQPFPAGEVIAGRGMSARDEADRPLPLQVDEVSSYADGSTRFAVFSTMLSDLAPGERRTVNLFGGKVGAPSAASGPSVDPPPADYDLAVAVDLFSPQVSQIVFGDRKDYTPGVPFRTGETVTIALGDRPEDRYSLTVTPEMAGGSFETLTKIAEAFVGVINQGHHFYAYKVGGMVSFERLWVTTRDLPGHPFTVRFLYAGQAHLQSHEVTTWRSPVHYTASVRPQLAGVGKAPVTWLRGPVATELSLVAPLIADTDGARHPQLTARFNIRYFTSGRRVRTDVTLENDWAYEPDPRNLLYDVAILQGGTQVFAAKHVLHFHHSRWHKVVWWGAAPAIQLRHDSTSLFRSRMVWNYDQAVEIPESVLADLDRRLKAADTSPMGPAFITQPMPMAGGRDDIGPLPRWSALYLLSQDPRAKAAMLANGDAAGTAPLHYRDRPTDLPVSLDDHPKIAMQFGSGGGKDVLPAVHDGDTAWQLDAAHQPSLAYLPYLVTGDQFYLDEVMFWANWNMGEVNPGYRGGAEGLINPDQIRAQAWAMRALGEAARIIPDRHPMKAYFVRKLKGNLEWYVRTYPRNPDHNVASALGWLDNVFDPGKTAPWQNDFVSLVFGQLAETGEPLAEEFYRWHARFVVGRWISQAQGYCRAMAPANFLHVRTGGGRAIQDWKTLFRENWPDVHDCPAAVTEGSPDLPAAYQAYSRAMLAVAAGLGVEGAAEAFARLRAETSRMTAAMASDPTWALAPRSSEKGGKENKSHAFLK